MDFDYSRCITHFYIGVNEKLSCKREMFVRLSYIWMELVETKVGLLDKRLIASG